MTREEQIKDHIHRYFVAVHGKDYFYKAPETFLNSVERWMLYTVANTDSGNEMAEREILGIEAHFEQLRKENRAV